jgi:glycosyltransferase involved in cell wall biosynthesis
LEEAFKNVPASIRLAREGGADEIWLLTSSAADAVEGVDRVFSRITQAQVATVYRSCDLILKLSLVEGMFGPPLEMFHCGGTAIVYNVTGHDEYIVHGRNALVAQCHDEAAVVRFIRQLKDFPPFLEALKANAIDAAAQWPDWPASTAQFRDAMEMAAANAALDRDSLGRYSRRIWALMESHRRQVAEQLLLETRIDAIYRSSSWRLTRPLRGLSRAMREKDFAIMAAKSALRQVQTSLRKPLELK